MSSLKFWAVVLALGLLIFVSASSARAQSTYGSITGSVFDPSGAAIADAQVTLTNLGTAEKRTQPTGADGLYTFVNLIPGNYRIAAEKPGFKRVTREPVVVQVQQNSKIDLSLPVGQTTETVEVIS